MTLLDLLKVLKTNRLTIHYGQLKETITEGNSCKILKKYLKIRVLEARLHLDGVHIFLEV